MILEKIKEKFLDEILESGQENGDLFVVIRKDHSHEILSWLRDESELQFNFLIDLAGVDRSKLNEAVRFEVVYHLYSLTHHHRLRLRIKVPESDLHIASVIDLWKAANWPERECWEMVGIVFDGHPNLRHLLLFEGFEGHPLRKDYPIAKRQKIPVTEERPQ